MQSAKEDSGDCSTEVLPQFDGDDLRDYLGRFDANGSALKFTLLLILVSGLVAFGAIRVPTDVMASATVLSVCEWPATSLYEPHLRTEMECDSNLRIRPAPGSPDSFGSVDGLQSSSLSSQQDGWPIHQGKPIGDVIGERLIVIEANVSDPIFSGLQPRTSVTIQGSAPGAMPQINYGWVTAVDRSSDGGDAIGTKRLTIALTGPVAPWSPGQAVNVAALSGNQPLQSLLRGALRGQRQMSSQSVGGRPQFQGW